MKEDFTVLSVSRDDLDYIGYEGSNLTDEQMERIANKITSISDGIWEDYWEALRQICENEDIPKKSL